MPSVRQGASVRMRVGICFVVVGLLAIVCVVWNSARRAGNMAAAAASDEQQFSQTAAGEETKIVLEIESAADGAIKGKVLEKKSDTVYTRTNTAAVAHSGSQTKFVMGKADDARAGAVVHVTGAAEKDHSITAEQIVILTGYVKVD